jgi:NAD(P)-dependent dehydrogenase (short-subunit alcohol dehydrogenase family)
VILISSGAAGGAYSTWGAYGSSKAAMNHLGKTMSVEEPAITTISIRPGVVDTAMQGVVRAHNTVMDATDAQRFKSLYEEGQLLRPEQPGNVIGRLALEAEKELSGKFLT